MRRRIPGRLAKRSPRAAEGEKKRSEVALFWVELVAGMLAIIAILSGFAGTVLGWVGDAFDGSGRGSVEVVLTDVANEPEGMTTVAGS